MSDSDEPDTNWPETSLLDTSNVSSDNSLIAYDLAPTGEKAPRRWSVESPERSKAPRRPAEGSAEESPAPPKGGSPERAKAPRRPAEGSPSVDESPAEMEEVRPYSPTLEEMQAAKRHARVIGQYELSTHARGGGDWSCQCLSDPMHRTVTAYAGKANSVAAGHGAAIKESTFKIIWEYSHNPTPGNKWLLWKRHAFPLNGRVRGTPVANLAAAVAKGRPAEEAIAAVVEACQFVFRHAHMFVNYVCPLPEGVSQDETGDPNVVLFLMTSALLTAARVTNLQAWNDIWDKSEGRAIERAVAVVVESATELLHADSWVGDLHKNLEAAMRNALSAGHLKGDTWIDALRARVEGMSPSGTAAAFVHTVL